MGILMKGEANPLLHTAFNSVLKERDRILSFSDLGTCSNILSLLCPAGPIAPNFQEEQDKLKLTKPVKTTFIPKVPITLGVTKAHRILKDPRNLESTTNLEPPEYPWPTKPSPVPPALSLVIH